MTAALTKKLFFRSAAPVISHNGKLQGWISWSLLITHLVQWTAAGEEHAISRNFIFFFFFFLFLMH
jgi:hypothetical protein